MQAEPGWIELKASRWRSINRMNSCEKYQWLDTPVRSTAGTVLGSDLLILLGLRFINSLPWNCKLTSSLNFKWILIKPVQQPVGWGIVSQQERVLAYGSQTLGGKLYLWHIFNEAIKPMTKPLRMDLVSPGSKPSCEGLSKWMKTGANGFDETGSPYKIDYQFHIRYILYNGQDIKYEWIRQTLYISYRKVTHASRWDGLGREKVLWFSRFFCKNLGISSVVQFPCPWSPYFGNSSGCCSRVTKAVPTWRFQLLETALTNHKLSNIDKSIHWVFRQFPITRFHLEVILLGEGLVQPTAEIL